MANTNTTEITFEARNMARTEQRLRELMSQLCDDVANGERTTDEANGIYERAATRWMHDS